MEVPNDVVRSLLGYLILPDKLQFRAVCTQWHAVVVLDYTQYPRLYPCWKSITMLCFRNAIDLMLENKVYNQELVEHYMEIAEDVVHVDEAVRVLTIAIRGNNVDLFRRLETYDWKYIKNDPSIRNILTHTLLLNEIAACRDESLLEYFVKRILSCGEVYSRLYFASVENDNDVLFTVLEDYMCWVGQNKCDSDTLDSLSVDAATKGNVGFLDRMLFALSASGNRHRNVCVRRIASMYSSIDNFNPTLLTLTTKYNRRLAIELVEEVAQRSSDEHCMKLLNWCNYA